MRLLEIMTGLIKRSAKAAREDKALHPHDADARERLAQISVSRRPMRWRMTPCGVARVFRKRPMAAWKGEVTHG